MHATGNTPAYSVPDAASLSRCLLVEDAREPYSWPADFNPEWLRHQHAMAPIDLQEFDDRYVVYVNTDFFPQNRLSVTLQESKLIVRSLAPDGTAEDRGNQTRKANQGFNVCFLLPPWADSSTAQAYLDRELLIVIMAKRKA